MPSGNKDAVLLKPSVQQSQHCNTVFFEPTTSFRTAFIQSTSALPPAFTAAFTACIYRLHGSRSILPELKIRPCNGHLEKRLKLLDMAGWQE